MPGTKGKYSLDDSQCMVSLQDNETLGVKLDVAIKEMLSDSNTGVNSMINRRVSLVYQVLFERIPPYGLCVYLIKCLFSVSRQE